MREAKEGREESEGRVRMKGTKGREGSERKEEKKGREGREVRRLKEEKALKEGTVRSASEREGCKGRREEETRKELAHKTVFMFQFPTGTVSGNLS